MQRKENESFEAYRARRAVANAETKHINHSARRGGATTSRQQLRSKSKPKGTYGANIIRALANRNITNERLKKHAAHVKHMAARKASRTGQAQNDDALLAA
jgi:hypothetical protein